LYAAAAPIAAPPERISFRHRIVLLHLAPYVPSMLLRPRKQAMLERLYAWYGRRLLRSSFARLWIHGAMPSVTQPLIAVANHSAWWDPIVALYLSHEPFRRDQYGIMEGKQLARYPFFRRLGAFGTTGTGPMEARALADLASRILTGGSNRLLWVFPQGALLPAAVPMRFRSGAARLARRCADAVVVPIAIRYPMTNDRRPECVVRIGDPTDLRGYSAKTATVALEAAVERELAAIDDDLLRDRRGGYRMAFEGGGSLAERYDRRARRKPVN
jgi:1-acyl-sn-glycerol-3-phosphate acyltransferase